MRVGANEPCPLPDDPLLAEAAVALSDAGHAAWVVDVEWRLVYVTDEYRRSSGPLDELAPIVVGVPMFGRELLDVSAEWRFALNTSELWAETLVLTGGFMLADMAGDKAQMSTQVDPSLHHIIDRLRTDPAAVIAIPAPATGVGGSTFRARQLLTRIRDEEGQVRGSVMLNKPPHGMSVLGAIALQHDPGHMQRTYQMVAADRRPAGILFADLESSSALARRLSTANYFALSRRMVRAVDQAVIDAGGLVGRHVGDGVAAFFPASVFASESRAVLACISAGRAVRDSMRHVAERSDLDPTEVSVRLGLHWGSTLYIGGITTGGRSEVTALGDEVNEAARIEASATGGLVLASKALVERLDRTDAAALGIETRTLDYHRLADIETATDKARRDAANIAVCEV